MLPVDMSQALSIILDTQTLGLDFLALKAFPFWVSSGRIYSLTRKTFWGQRRVSLSYDPWRIEHILFVVLFITRERKQAHGQAHASLLFWFSLLSRADNWPFATQLALLDM